MLPILETEEFNKYNREKLLDYSAYRSEASDLAARIPKAAARLSDATWMAGKDAATLMRATASRAEYALDLLTLSYSAGVSIDELRSYFVSVLEYYEEAKRYIERFNETPEGERVQAPVFALADVEFERANRLICFAVLLGWQSLLQRVAHVVDYNNEMTDAMVERLLAVYLDGRSVENQECLRHLPYFKTIKIFAAATSDRPALMSEYLDDWYTASRREPYFDSHKRGTNFRGYWSWESAAITQSLAIDDSTFADKEFFPAPLLSFAKTAMASLNDPHYRVLKWASCDAGPVRFAQKPALGPG